MSKNKTELISYEEYQGQKMKERHDKVREMAKIVKQIEQCDELDNARILAHFLCKDGLYASAVASLLDIIEIANKNDPEDELGLLDWLGTESDSLRNIIKAIGDQIAKVQGKLECDLERMMQP